MWFFQILWLILWMIRIIFLLLPLKKNHLLISPFLWVRHSIKPSVPCLVRTSLTAHPPMDVGWRSTHRHRPRRRAPPYLPLPPTISINSTGRKGEYRFQCVSVGTAADVSVLSHESFHRFLTRICSIKKRHARTSNLFFVVSILLPKKTRRLWSCDPCFVV